MRSSIRLAACLVASALVALANGEAQSAAICGTAAWVSWNESTATALLNGVSITARTSGGSPFAGFRNDHFGLKDHPSEVCGDWEGSMPLTHDDFGVIASNVNGGDYQEFSFSSPIKNLLIYIENLDSGSSARISSDGGLELIDASRSISYSAGSEGVGQIVSSNLTFNGEGEAAFRLTGETTRVRLDFDAGVGDNGVLYTFAEECDSTQVIPEPGSIVVMAGLFFVGGGVAWWRRRVAS